MPLLLETLCGGACCSCASVPDLGGHSALYHHRAHPWHPSAAASAGHVRCFGSVRSTRHKSNEKVRCSYSNLYFHVQKLLQVGMYEEPTLYGDASGSPLSLAPVVTKHLLRA